MIALETIPERAVKIFESVSNADPNTIPGQAVLIALICQRHNIDPLMLLAGILNTDSIPRLVTYANERHREIGVPIVVTHEDMLRIVDHDFNVATRYVRLSRSELLLLKGYSKRLKDSGATTNQRDYLLHEAAEEMLQRRQPF